ncbi:MAG: S-adenosylmethionine:tRNA ribosyltransferase-isomerase [Myxococcota bacterium]
MTPATEPRTLRDGARLLTGERDADETRVARLADLLRPGDLLVVNDAATMPASLRAQRANGASVELRLTGPPTDQDMVAVLFGAGDWRTPTEDRPLPPVLTVGERLWLETAASRTAPPLGEGSPRAQGMLEVRAVDPSQPRLLTLHARANPWSLLFRYGRPVQYSHLRAPLALWDVQTAYAARPWAVEPPSAGLPLSWSVLEALEERSIRIASLTHAAGLSSTGDPELDRRLPFPERYRIEPKTLEAITAAKRRGGRVIAVGTTVVRALEDMWVTEGQLRAGERTAQLVLGPEHRLKVVDGILTGVHAPGESHFELLTAFRPASELRRVVDAAHRRGLLTHEFGDLLLIFKRSRSKDDVNARRTAGPLLASATGSTAGP